MSIKTAISKRVSEKLASLNSLITGVSDEVMESLNKNIQGLEEMSFARTKDSLASSENIADARRLYNSMTGGPDVTQEYNDFRDAEIMSKMVADRQRDLTTYSDVVESLKMLNPNSKDSPLDRVISKEQADLLPRSASAAARLEGALRGLRSGSSTPLSRNDSLDTALKSKKIDSDYLLNNYTV